MQGLFRLWMLGRIKGRFSCSFWVLVMNRVVFLDDCFCIFYVCFFEGWMCYCVVGGKLVELDDVVNECGCFVG